MRVILYGGLGNQIFKYVAALKFTEKRNSVLKLDESWYRQDKNGNSAPRNFMLMEFPKIRLKNHQIARKPNFLNRIVFGLLQRNVFIQLCAGLLTEKTATYQHSWPYFHTIVGDFENQKYFPSEVDLSGLLEFPKVESPILDSFLNEIAESKQPIIAVHVRLTDFLELSDIYGVLSLEYYLECKAQADQFFTAPVFWLFSDDPSQVPNSLTKIFHFSKVIQPAEIQNEIEVLNLMSRCHGLITANSTFSYWAGYIMTSKDQGAFVCAPSRYHNLENYREYSSGLHLPFWKIIEN